MEFPADDRKEPLLGSPPVSSAFSFPFQPKWQSILLLIPLLLLHVCLGAIERLFFTRMARSTTHGVVLIHTVLAGFASMLFVALRLARSQSSHAPVAAPHLRLHPLEMLQMAVLDALHSLLTIQGASGIAGTIQAMLLQGVLPMTLLVLFCSRQRRFRWLQYTGGAIVGAAECVLLIQPSLPDWLTHSKGEGADSGQASRFHHSPYLWHMFMPLVGAGGDGVARTATAALSRRMLSDAGGELFGRLLFFAGVACAVISTWRKRVILSRTPVDMLVLNSWLCPLQLGIGLLLGPLLLLAVNGQQILETFSRLGKALHCCTAGLSDEAVGSLAPEEFAACNEQKQTLPALMLFFVTSSLWSGLSYAILRWGNESVLNVASALILPATILVFVRPISLPPYSWLAPPEPMGEGAVWCFCIMCVGLAAYHARSCAFSSVDS